VKEPAEVLEALEDAIEGLREAAQVGAVLVEGRRDAAALDALGVVGNIEVVNRGAPLLELCDALAAEYDAVLVLTDWDLKGDELARQLSAGLRRGSVSVDAQTRESLRRLTRGAIHAVEELPSFHRRVAAAVASKGAAVRTNTDWKARKELTIVRRAARRQRGGPPGRRR
jgi:5S rRNA maturation endonuclease (ribonuclease M5)